MTISAPDRYTVRRVRLDASWARYCSALQDLYGPSGGEAPKRGQHAWLAFDGHGNLVAFASARRVSRDTVALTNCVVAPHARGAGLQTKLLRARLVWAMADCTGVRRVTTYTSANNWHSARNVINAGFRVSAITPAADAAGGAFIEFEYGATK